MNFEDDFRFPSFKLGWDLAVDVYESDGDVIAEMNIPGIDPDNIDISIEDDYLYVKGSRQEKEEVKEKDYYHKEIRRGSFERVINLPCLVDADKTEAHYEEGVLKIIMPKKASSERNKVKVRVKK
jgi:HSP20 family protein